MISEGGVEKYVRRAKDQMLADLHGAAFLFGHQKDDWK